MKLDDITCKKISIGMKENEYIVHQKFGTRKNKKHTTRMEQEAGEVFKTIPNSMKEGNIPMEEKIEKTMQDMESYRSHLTELIELLVAPITPLEVRAQRE
jgi:predicted transcriptional regulator